MRGAETKQRAQVRRDLAAAYRALRRNYGHAAARAAYAEMRCAERTIVNAFFAGIEKRSPAAAQLFAGFLGEDR